MLKISAKNVSICTENTNLSIIVTMATKQPNFTSSKNRKTLGF